MLDLACIYVQRPQSNRDMRDFFVYYIGTVRKVEPCQARSLLQNHELLVTDVAIITPMRITMENEMFRNIKSNYQSILAYPHMIRRTKAGEQ